VLAEALVWVQNLVIQGISVEACYQFLEYFCTQTIIGGAYPKIDAGCDLYCDRNFDPAVSDCDTDADCLPGAPEFTPSPCCQGYNLLCDNVHPNALHAWEVNSACVWRRCMGFSSAPRLSPRLFTPLLWTFLVSILLLL